MADQLYKRWRIVRTHLPASFKEAGAGQRHQHRPQQHHISGRQGHGRDCGTTHSFSRTDCVTVPFSRDVCNDGGDEKTGPHDSRCRVSPWRTLCCTVTDCMMNKKLILSQ